MKKTTKKEAKKIDLGKVTGVVDKVPAFLARMKKELERLLSYIEKAENAIAAFTSIKLLTKEQKVQKKLLEKQVKAMKAYRDALQARVDNESGKL